MPENGAPVFPAFVIQRTPQGVWLIGVRCGYCGRTHQHGGGSGDEPGMHGHWSEHCMWEEPMQLPGYNLAPETDDIDWQAEREKAVRLVAENEAENLRRAQERHQRTLDRISAINGEIERGASALSRGARETEARMTLDAYRARSARRNSRDGGNR